MGAGQNRDEGVVELLGRGVAHGLLRDADLRGDGIEEAETAEPEAEGC